jgi:hypothetical protein
MDDLTLETLLTSDAGFRLPASPLQRAIARAADGVPIGDALVADDCQKHFGCLPAEVGAVRPSLVVVVAGVRSGKSLIAGAAALKSALTADLSRLMPHEVARVAIVAPTVDNATATFRLLVGAIEASPQLRALVVGDATADTITIRRADRRLVEIVVVAAHRGAVTLRSRWLAGFVLDEVALFGSEPTGAAINAEELLRAGETRLVRGAQGWLISSPYGPEGLLFRLWREHFGVPGRVLVVHAPTQAMNPAFPLEDIEAIRRRDPDVAAREYDATWLDAVTQYLSTQQLDAARRDTPAIRPPPGFACAFAMDAGTRGNSWTLAGAWSQGGRVVVGGCWQWTGSKQAPLSPAVVLRDIATICRSYSSSTVLCDRWSFDANRDIAAAHGVRLIEVPSPQVPGMDVQACYGQLKTTLGAGTLELPPDPIVRADLMGIRRKATANAVRIELTKTPDGRHCDYAPSVALAATAAVQYTAAVAHRNSRLRDILEQFADRGWIEREPPPPNWRSSAYAAGGYDPADAGRRKQ